MVHRAVWFVLSIVCAASGHAQQDNASPPPGRWRSLTLPATADRPLEALRFEAEGAAWVLLDGAPYYWDGARFRAPRSGAPALRGPLLGGFDRPLLAAVKGADNDGALFRLVDGDCVFETAYYHDVPHEPPAVYVTRSGQLFHWGNRFLAVRAKSSSSSKIVSAMSSSPASWPTATCRPSSSGWACCASWWSRRGAMPGVMPGARLAAR